MKFKKAIATTSFYCAKPLSSEEHKADLYSLNIIYDYAADQFDTFEEPSQFIQQYGIPIRMFDDASNLFKKHDDLVF